MPKLFFSTVFRYASQWWRPPWRLGSLQIAGSSARCLQKGHYAGKAWIICEEEHSCTPSGKPQGFGLWWLFLSLTLNFSLNALILKVKLEDEWVLCRGQVSGTTSKSWRKLFSFGEGACWIARPKEKWCPAGFRQREAFEDACWKQGCCEIWQCWPSGMLATMRYWKPYASNCQRFDSKLSCAWSIRNSCRFQAANVQSNLSSVLQGTLEEANGHGSVLVRKDALQVRNAPFFLMFWGFTDISPTTFQFWLPGWREKLSGLLGWWNSCGGLRKHRLSSCVFYMQTVRLVQVLGHWYECSWDGVGPLKRGFLQAPDLGFLFDFSRETEQKCLNLYIYMYIYKDNEWYTQIIWGFCTWL